MASGFDPTCRVISYDPRPQRAAQRAFVLWPAWVYKVIAPEARERQLNFLQRTVLALCHAGVRTAREVEDLLGIALDLAALLFVQLQGLGLIDEEARLTEKGREAFEDEVLEQHPQMVAGYVFQDRNTGELWPRFMESLQEVEVQCGHGYPLLVNGPTGRRRPQRAFPMPANDTEMAAPDSEQILRATWLHRRRLRSKSDRDDADDGGTGVRPGPIPHLDRVAPLEKKPIPVYVATVVYRPADAVESVAWLVADPFVPGPSRRLTQSLAERLPGCPELRDFLEHMLGSVAPTGGEVSEFIDRLAREAAAAVASALDPSLPRKGPLHERLVAMERAHLAARANPDREGLGELANRAQQALERVFTVLREAHPTQGCASLLTGDERHNEGVLDAVGGQVGITAPLPKGLSRVKKGKIQAAADRGDQSLRPLALAALLAAYREPAHPLRLAAKSFPDILHRVHALARVRDSVGAHDSDREVDQDEVFGLVPLVYRIAATLLVPPSTKAGAGRDEPAVGRPAHHDPLDSTHTRVLARNSTT